MSYYKEVAELPPSWALPLELRFAAVAGLHSCRGIRHRDVGALHESVTLRSRLAQVRGSKIRELTPLE